MAALLATDVAAPRSPLAANDSVIDLVKIGPIFGIFEAPFKTAELPIVNASPINAELMA
jgi:hypothetical protein